VGITILSVFTATVTTVLTQESLGMRQNIQGRRVSSILHNTSSLPTSKVRQILWFQIGVLNGTDEYRIVITQGGQPVGEKSDAMFNAG
jgi:hypothetical protein